MMEAGTAAAPTIIKNAARMSSVSHSSETPLPSESTVTTAYLDSANQISDPVNDLEKEKETEKSPEALGNVQPVLDEAAGLEKATDITNGDSNLENTSYPTGFKLATVTLALMLAVLCVALDNTVTSLSRHSSLSHSYRLILINCHRSSQRPFRVSQTISKT